MLLGRLRIRGKLTLLLIVPLLAMAALAVPVVFDRIEAADRAADTAEMVRVAGRVGTLVQDLQQERLLSVGYLIGVAERGRLIEQAAKVTDHVADVRHEFGDELPAEVSAALDRVPALTGVRAAVLAKQATADEVLRAFGPLHQELINSLRLTERADTTTAIGRQVMALDAMMRTDEGLSVGATLIVLVAFTKSPMAANQYVANMAALLVHTSRFRTFATEEQRALNALEAEAVAARTSEDFLSTGALDPAKAVAGFPVQTLFPSVGSMITLGQFVEKKVVNDVLNDAAREQQRATTIAYLVGGLVLLVLLAVVLLSVAVARAIANPLTRLTGSANRIARLTEAELVRIVDDETESARAVRLDPVEVTGRDEIGDLARAFDRVQGTAARLVERQAVSRRNVAQMFGHVGRRTQNLVNRQIALIDRLEQQETEPNRLRHLYRLDHISNRLRRNAASLVVLSGATGADSHVSPLPLADVVRLALGEVEAYPRVDVQVGMEVSVAPAVVSDLVLALGELMENATAFSPPHTRVTVTAQPVDAGGVRVSVVDRGIGMTDDRMAEENARLARRERLDLAPTEVLGLFVVGRLARRHQWRVLLSPTPGGGTTATLELSGTLLVREGVDPLVPARPIEPPPTSRPEPAKLTTPESTPAGSAVSPAQPGAAATPAQPGAATPAKPGLPEPGAGPLTPHAEPRGPDGPRLPAVTGSTPSVNPTPPANPAPAANPVSAAHPGIPVLPVSAALAANAAFDAAALRRASESLGSGLPWNAFAAVLNTPGDGAEQPTVRGQENGRTAANGDAGDEEQTREIPAGLSDGAGRPIRQRVPGTQLPSTGSPSTVRGGPRNGVPGIDNPGAVTHPTARVDRRVPAAGTAAVPTDRRTTPDPVAARALIEQFESGVRRAQQATGERTIRPAGPTAPAGPAHSRLSRRVPGAHLDSMRLHRPSPGGRAGDPDEVRDLINQFESGVARALRAIDPDQGTEPGAPR